MHEIILLFLFVLKFNAVNLPKKRGLRRLREHDSNDAKSAFKF